MTTTTRQNRPPW